MGKIRETVGLKIYEQRERLGLTQSELAKATKSSKTTINRIEKGRQFPRFDTLYAVCEKLGIPLIGEPPPESKNEIKATLIISIVGALAALDESKLSRVFKFINDLSSSKSDIG